mmetsp:Transcript_7376/g.15269  ORF Transcript_7376/g.15269 Transcript_7376/m.15269 type:complete len:204 (-) Transcript_7376:15-626(-)
MRQTKTGSLFEASMDLFACFLQILCFFLLRNHFLHVFVHFFFHSVVVFLVFKVLPVTNQEFHGLKGFRAFVLLVGRNAIRAFHGQSSIFRKECELLQVVFLNSLVHVVDLIGTQEGAQTKDGRGQRHGGFIVKHSLRIHNENGHVFVSLFDKMGLAPHPDSGRVSLGSTPPVKGVILDRFDIFEPLLITTIEVSGASAFLELS